METVTALLVWVVTSLGSNLLAPIWPQTHHYTRGTVTTKPGAFCLPAACPLNSHLLEAQDKILQAGFKLRKTWGIKSSRRKNIKLLKLVDNCQHEHGIATVFGKILWHGLFLGRGSGHHGSWWQPFEFWHLPQYRRKRSGMFTIEKTCERNLRPRRWLV